MTEGILKDNTPYGFNDGSSLGGGTFTPGSGNASENEKDAEAE